MCRVMLLQQKCGNHKFCTGLPCTEKERVTTKKPNRSECVRLIRIESFNRSEDLRIFFFQLPVLSPRSEIFAFYEWKNHI